MNCILCKGEYIPYLTGFDNTHTSTRDQFKILKCSTCGLEKTNADIKNLGKYYPKNYYSYTGGISWMEKIIRRSYTLYYKGGFDVLKYMIYGKMIKYPCKIEGGKFLDIGCGNDSHFKFLETYGWKCHGFEIGQGGRKGNIFYGTNILSFDDKDRYDRITLWHVLEHFDDPIAYMTKVTSLLDYNGSLIVSVPNQNSWYAKLFGGYWYNRDIPRHLYNWSPNTLEILGELIGLKISRIYHQSLFSGANSLLLVLKYKLSLSDNVSSILRLFLYLIFLPLDLLSNLFRRGDIITVVFKYSNKLNPND